MNQSYNGPVHGLVNNYNHSNMVSMMPPSTSTTNQNNMPNQNTNNGSQSMLPAIAMANLPNSYN